MSEAVESVSESDQGPSTGRDVTRKVSPQDLINFGAQQQAAAGARPSVPQRFLRSDELTRPSPTLNVGNIEAIEGFDDDTKGYVADAQTAFDTMHKAVEKIIEAREASKRNPTWNEAAQIINTAVLADKVTTQTTALVQNAYKALEKRIAHVEGELKQPLDASVASPFATEVRNHAKGLTAAKRNEFVMDLIAAGDAKSLGALLAAPGFLSGLSEEQVRVFTEQHNRKAQPLLAKRLAVMQKAYEKLADAGSLFIVQAEKAQGVNATVVARLRAAQSKAEAAFR